MDKNTFIGYEYQDITVKRSMASMYTDCYKNFGWELDGTNEPISKIDSVEMKFKRDRKIRNKAELTRLQRNFDACVSEILSLESKEYIIASVVAYMIGIIGTAFMAGSVFAVTSEKILLCILLAVPAFIGWIIPYFCYKAIVRKKIVQIAPLIEQKYEEVYVVCEKANALLDS